MSLSYSILSNAILTVSFVDCKPFCWHFMCPLSVAGDVSGAGYFQLPSKESSLVGLRDIGGGTLSGMFLTRLCAHCTPFLLTVSLGRGVVGQTRMAVWAV